VSVAVEKGMAAYEDEISALRDIIETRRNELDSATVAVLEKNLKLIDQAISESKAALTANPASTFLAGQVGRAYDSKLELLRSAALLPSRT
jgi:flagellar biosynthesis/type III secretory pathway M-ring protein FliF/YscJ